MKITNFQLTLRQAVTKDSYDDNYYVNIDENGVANVSHPYKSIPYQEQAIILDVIQTAITKYGEVVELCDRANRALKLEEYAPIISEVETTEEEKAVAVAKLSASQEIELADKSTVLLSCALGDGELSTGEVEVKDALFEETTKEAEVETKTLAQQIEEHGTEILVLK